MRQKFIYLSLAFFLNCFIAQSQEPIPADADGFYNKAMTSINAKHTSWIKRTAIAANAQKMDEARIRNLASGYGAQNNFNEMDIEALVMLVMMQVSKDNTQDMKDMMEEMKRTNEQKQKMREAQEEMKKQRYSMSRAMLDSFRALTKPQVTVSTPQKLRVQTKPTINTKLINPSITKVNPSVNRTVTVAEVDEVIDSLQSKMDILGEMSENTSLRLQLYQDRYSKFMSALSNIMKKISETQDQIIQNMK